MPRREDRAAGVQPDVPNLRRPGARARTAIAYLRPETAQAIFAQFKNVLETSRQKVPFGIAQVGKAFRNEVTPRNYTFRSREFEQMELEFFIKPDEVVEAISGSVTHRCRNSTSGNSTLDTSIDWGWEAWHKYWVEERIRFYEGIGLPRTHAGRILAKAGGTGALRPRLRGHSVQVSVRHAGTRKASPPAAISI